MSGVERASRGLLSALIPVLAVLLAVATASLLLIAIRVDPISAYGSMLSAALGSPFAISTTVVKSVPRLLAALGIAIALRAGLWNIGAEGQLYVGAVATTAVALFGPRGLGFPLAALLSLTAGALAGAVWGSIPGFLRATRGISEVITSLMLVYVAIQAANYLVEGPWLVPGSTFPASAPVPPGSGLPILVPRTLFNAGALLASFGIVVAWFLVAHSTLGLRLRALGGNERAAHFAGVPVGRTIVLAMALAGGFAGLAGGIEVLGARGRLIEGFSSGYGFDAIAIALLGRLHPLGILGAALLFGALDAGGSGLKTAARGAPSAIVQITGAVAVLYVLIGFGIGELVDRRRQAQLARVAAHHEDELAQPTSAMVEGR